MLFVNTPFSQRFRGGDIVQMQKTAEALSDLGIQVSLSFDARPDASGFDVAHVFNLRTLRTTFTQVECLRRQGIPIGMSPIYLDPSYGLWGGQAVRSIFVTPRPLDEAARLVGCLRRKQLTVAMDNGSEFTATSVNRTAPDYDHRQREILRFVDHLLPNSGLEMHHLSRTLGVTSIPFTIVPYAVDPNMFLDPDPAPFVRRHGIRDFVLQVGRIERSKNQAMLAYALRDMEYPVVLIGGTRQTDYVEACRRIGPKHLRILDHMDPRDLASAYAAAKVHALPSWVETCGLVSMEAALADCKVVVSNVGYEINFFENLAYYCDPTNPDSIRNAVEMAMHEAQGNSQHGHELKERILRDYTWPRAAAACLKAYQSMLSARDEEKRERPRCNSLAT